MIVIIINSTALKKLRPRKLMDSHVRTVLIVNLAIAKITFAVHMVRLAVLSIMTALQGMYVEAVITAYKLPQQRNQMEKVALMLQIAQAVTAFIVIVVLLLCIAVIITVTVEKHLQAVPQIA
jgi:Ca2+/Na+ antiporter